MIWDLQIDRGATTLSAWTRSRGAYVWPLPVAPPASLAVTKVADSASVNSGSQAGFTVTLSNAGAGAANGISVTDALPAKTGVNWTLDAANSGAGWSVSGSAPNQSLVYSPTTLGANASTAAHVISSTTSGSCGNLNNTASFTSGNGGSGQASASVSVNCATVSISKVADASSVAAGAQIGFTVSISNSTSGTANALSVTDSLPAGTGLSWSVDAANSSAGWSISGSAPNQSLVYSPTSLAGNSSTSVHVISATSGGSCGTTYNNTASFSTSNAGSGQASASVGVQCSAQVAQITGSGTACSQFGAGTSTSLASLQYTLRSGSIFKVTPTSFTYWVKVGATAGSNSKVIDQTITSGNFSTLFALASGSAVYDTNCVKISKPTFSQSSGTITATWNAASAGTYYLAVKLDASSVQRKAAPSPGTSVHYDFSTTGISGSLAGINLTP
jgi:uncharacterized repeat protein (TIGR01451 family)